MKKKSIFTIFAALTMVLGFAMTGLGQTSANMTPSATIVSQVIVSSVNNLNFGNILTGLAGTKSVGLNNQVSVTGGLISAPGITPQHGVFSIVKAAQTSVVIEYTTAFPTCNIDAIDGTTGDPITATGGSTIVTPAFITATTVYVHLAATITTVANQVVGIYNGLITLNAEYN
jgi:hypothetical protein